MLSASNIVKQSQALPVVKKNLVTREPGIVSLNTETQKSLIQNVTSWIEDNWFIVAAIGAAYLIFKK
jgi:hypothetical protein